MNYFIFRNSTLENVFKGRDFKFSGYNDITNVDYLADSYIWFYLCPIKVNIDVVAEEINTYLSNIEFILNSIASDKVLYIFTIEKFGTSKIIQSNYKLEKSIYNFNEGVKDFEIKYSNVKVLNFGDFTQQFSDKMLIDWKYYFTSKIQLNPKLHNILYSWFMEQMKSINHIRKKCLVVDLDNTLWGGVLGEDGNYGVQIGDDYPGNAFLFFQEKLLELSRSGVILAVCSKNNYSDVEEFFLVNKNNRVNLSDFVALKINWENKAQNISELANELNIGLDSIVFVDDSESEIGLVKNLIPEVKAELFPKKPYEIPDFVNDLINNYFKIFKLTNEDLIKSDSYRENIKRNLESKKFSDINDYLKSLDIELTIKKINESNFSRVVQMIQKTNQFNLTSYRYSEIELLSMINNEYFGYTISYKDRFGTNGITGLIFLKHLDSETIEIDLFLLSCRILGKKVEFYFLDSIIANLKGKGIRRVIGKYIPSKKNIQVADFYTKMGFEIDYQNEEKTIFSISLFNYNCNVNNMLKIFFNER